MVVFVAGAVLRSVMSAVQEWFLDVSILYTLASSAISLGINLLVFSFLYRFLSKEPSSWRLCFVAGAVAAVLLEMGGRLLGALSFGSNFSAYGLVGSFLVVQLWIYYNAMVLLLGALVVRIEARPSGDFREMI